MAKLHWTQTPEGRAKMSAAQKKLWANKREKLEAKAQRKIAHASRKFRSEHENRHAEYGPTIVIQGWTITIVGNQLRVERES